MIVCQAGGPAVQLRKADEIFLCKEMVVSKAGVPKKSFLFLKGISATDRASPTCPK